MVNAFLLAVLAASTPSPGERLDGLCAPLRQGVAIDLAGTSYRPEQAHAPDEPLASVDARQSMLLLADGRFLLRTSNLYPGDIEFRYRTLGDRGGERTIDELGWRDGDSLQQDDAATAARDLADLRMLAPGLLACDAIAGNPGKLPTEGVISFKDGAGREVTLAFDASGDLASAKRGDDLYRYEGWRTDTSIRLPATIIHSRDGRERERWTRVRARPARAADTALLSLPDGHRPADPAPPLHATLLGDGAYRVDGAPSGYHTGFVVGTKGIVLFDAPIDVDEARAVRAVIEKTAPGRAITHVVISHVHGDHVAGLPAHADAEVLVGAGGTAALRRQLGDRLPARVREVTQAETLELGDRGIRVLPIASGHATTMLVGFDPASGTLFQGDLFYLPERGAVPAAFSTGRELVDLIDGAALDVRAIVGVHGRSGTPADLRDAVARIPARNDRGCVGEQMTGTAACAAMAPSSP
ncbi:MBL fold metallo-hydrolase [Pseudoxanthomonas beigongshangi]